MHRCNMHQQVDRLSHRVTKIFLTSLSAHGSYLKILEESTVVDVRVTLLVEDDKIKECIYPYIELETLRVWMTYMCMHMMDIDAICINK